MGKRNNFSRRMVCWLPVVTVLTAVSWGYYAFIFHLCFRIVDNSTVRALYFILGHSLIAMFLWSYLRTIIEPLPVIPNVFAIPKSVKNELNIAPRSVARSAVLDNFIKKTRLPAEDRYANGAPRYCPKCMIIKPDRTHHCSSCRKCVLKFDHHCPWVNTCVNFRNQKFFILFLGYGLAMCAFFFFSILPYFIRYWKYNIGVHVFFLLVFSIALSIWLGCLLYDHLYLVVKNRTTNETFRSASFSYDPDERSYDLGIRRNFKQVFGSSFMFSIIPIFTSLGNGAIFPTRSDSIYRFNEPLQLPGDYRQTITEKEYV